MSRRIFDWPEDGTVITTGKIADRLIEAYGFTGDTIVGDIHRAVEAETDADKASRLRIAVAIVKRVTA